MSHSTAFDEGELNNLSLLNPLCIPPESKTEIGDLPTPLSNVQSGEQNQEEENPSSELEISKQEIMNTESTQLDNKTEETSSNEDKHLEVNAATNNHLEHKKVLQSIIVNIDYDLLSNKNVCIPNLEQLKGKFDFSSEISMINYLENRVKELIQELNERIHQLDEQQEVKSSEEMSSSLQVCGKSIPIHDSNEGKSELIPIMNDTIEILRDEDFVQVIEEGDKLFPIYNELSQNNDESYMNGYTTRVLEIINEMKTMTSKKQNKFMKQHTSNLTDFELDKIRQFMDTELKRDSFWSRLSSQFTLKRRSGQVKSYKKMQKKGGLLCWRRYSSTHSSLASEHPELGTEDYDDGGSVKTIHTDTENPEEQLTEIPLTLK